MDGIESAIQRYQAELEKCERELSKVKQEQQALTGRESELLQLNLRLHGAIAALTELREAQPDATAT